MLNRGCCSRLFCQDSMSWPLKWAPQKDQFTQITPGTLRDVNVEHHNFVWEDLYVTVSCETTWNDREYRLDLYKNWEYVPTPAEQRLFLGRNAAVVAETQLQHSKVAVFKQIWHRNSDGENTGDCHYPQCLGITAEKGFNKGERTTLGNVMKYSLSVSRQICSVRRWTAESLDKRPALGLETKLKA